MATTTRSQAQFFLNENKQQQQQSLNTPVLKRTISTRSMTASKQDNISSGDLNIINQFDFFNDNNNELNHISKNREETPTKHNEKEENESKITAIHSNTNNTTKTATNNTIVTRQSTSLLSDSFRKKILDQNFKIKIPQKSISTTTTTTLQRQDSKQQQQQQQQTPLINTPSLIHLNEILNSEDIASLATPRTEGAILQFLHSLPGNLSSGSANYQHDNGLNSQSQSNHIFSNNQIIDSLGFNEQDLEKFLANSPQILDKMKIKSNFFLSTFTPNPKSHDNQEFFIIKDDNNNNNQVSIDHSYPATSTKRKYDQVSNNITATDTPDTSNDSEGRTSDSFDKRKRKQVRARGIYRAVDVTNEEEKESYLERRKKNNISSKISRANRKKQNEQMKAKSEYFENENKRLEKLIVKLENVNNIIKNNIIEMIN
jgi:hypothetical protein